MANRIAGITVCSRHPKKLRSLSIKDCILTHIYDVFDTDRTIQMTTSGGPIISRFMNAYRLCALNAFNTSVKVYLPSYTNARRLRRRIAGNIGMLTSRQRNPHRKVVYIIANLGIFKCVHRIDSKTRNQLILQY